MASDRVAVVSIIRTIVVVAMLAAVVLDNNNHLGMHVMVQPFCMMRLLEAPQTSSRAPLVMSMSVRGIAEEVNIFPA